MTPTIVIVGYRAYEELEQCLASLETHERGARVIVVDHAADAARGAALAARFPSAMYFPRSENPGFAAGVNYAAARSQPGPLLLLNPDSELTAPVLAPLVDLLDRRPSAGVVGGLVRDPGGAVQASARRFPDATTALGGRTSWLSRVMPHNPFTRRNLTTDPGAGIAPVDWVSGAFMCIRRETFTALDGFDEGFFLYWEDADFCRRARAAGWVTLYAPVAEVTHFTGRTSRHSPLRSLWAFHRSALRYHWKHGSRLARLTSPLVAAGLAVRFLVRAVSRR